MLKRSFNFHVTALIPADLLPPEILSAGWPAEQVTVMAMPEAPMHKNYCVPSGQHEIRLARKISIMQAKPVSKSVQAPPHRHFRLGILTLYACHHATACYRIDNVTRQVRVSVAAVPARSRCDRPATEAYAQQRPSLPAQLQSCQTGDRPVCPIQG